MYDEDRNTALSMYSELFERAPDPEALIAFLNSPTRQAVLLARSYNARERDLAIRGQAGSGDADVDSGAVPPFVKIIRDLTAKAEAQELLSSYASAWVDTDESRFRMRSYEETTDDAAEGSESSERAEDAEGNEAEPAPLPSGPELSSERFPDADAPLETLTEEKVRGTELSSGAEAPASDAPNTAEEPQNTDKRDENDKRIDRKGSVEQLMADFMKESAEKTGKRTGSGDSEGTLQAAEEENGSAPASHAEPLPVRKKTADNSFGFDDESPSSTESAYDTYLKKSGKDKKENRPGKTFSPPEADEEHKELSVPLLILYILVSVPVTALLLLLLLIPSAISLALSILLTVFGIQVISSAFSGFAVFADIMVVLGAALILIALGLLFLWLFLWLIGHVMVDLINSAIVLGQKIVMSGGDVD